MNHLNKYLIGSVGESHIGRVRSENQDSYYIDDNHSIYVICDGMGGMENGEKAAKTVSKLFPLMLLDILDQQITDNELSLKIEQILIDLNLKLIEEVGEKSGTTIVFLLIRGSRAYFGNLGDSRAYIKYNKTLERITRDHNVASILIESGKLTQNDAMFDPMRNMLTEFLGSSNTIHPNLYVINLKPDTRILLCSDGIHSMISDEMITEILAQDQNLERTVASLIDHANQAGGYDNCTVVLIDITSESGNK